MSMNTRISGSARVDITRVLPSGEVRGLMKLIKIAEDVRSLLRSSKILKRLRSKKD
jgi:hypothetical protein